MGYFCCIFLSHCLGFADCGSGPRGDFGLAADLRYGAIPDVEKAIARKEVEIEEEKGRSDRMVSETVGPEQVPSYGTYSSVAALLPTLLPHIYPRGFTTKHVFDPPLIFRDNPFSSVLF